MSVSKGSQQTYILKPSKMKKQILNIGKALNKNEQTQVKGGVNCLQCQSYCMANNPNDRQGYVECMVACFEQYC
ncbi:MAG: hypothetical protein Roseis2KO_48140 [Roseivirga sp.]